MTGTRRQPPREPDHRPLIPAGQARQLAVPLASTLVLLVVAIATVGLLTGDLPLIRRASSGDGPAKTPTPSNVVVVDPRSKVPGTIAYIKAGNLWVQSGATARQLTSGGSDAMPAWAPDGSAIYVVRSAPQTGSFPDQGRLRQYSLSVPSLVSLSPDGSGTPTVLLTGSWASGRYSWSYFIRQPAISPDGTRIAVISDGPDPTKSDVVLQLVDAATGKLTRLGVPETAPLGHQDPVWRPDGAVLAYVRPGRDGTRGISAIWRYDLTSKKASAVTGPGYLQPSWSPDGLYLTATRSDSFGTDVAVLDAATGSELVRVTHDGRSFAPVWSPAGDSIAFLRVDGGVVDLVQVPIQRQGSWQVGAELELTRAAGLDAESRPAWYIPPDQLPHPTPSPVPAATAGPPGASVAATARPGATPKASG